MLSPEHVHARRHKDRLELVALGPKRARAMELAELSLDLAKDHLGRPREELEQAWAAIDVEARDRKLFEGLCKRIDDALVFEAMLEGDPVDLRRDVFLRSAEARRALGQGESLDRDALLHALAGERGTDATTLERALYADLRGAQRLTGVGPVTAAALVESHDLAQAQAVLLRATRVTVELEGASPLALRGLLRKLKFQRLLASVHPTETGHRLELDGPFSLFDAVTKYGLALALALPSILACGRHRLCADLRWGKERLPLQFVLEGAARAADSQPARLSDEAESLRARLAAKDAWHVEIADTILDLPGVGACVPDLVVTQRATGKRAYVEVMGFWSRDAVWRRVELVEQGLGERILFCVSERLRVSEAVLPDEAPAGLLVYKGVIALSAFEAKLVHLLRSA